MHLVTAKPCRLEIILDLLMRAVFQLFCVLDILYSSEGFSSLECIGKASKLGGLSSTQIVGSCLPAPVLSPSAGSVVSYLVLLEKSQRLIWHGAEHVQPGRRCLFHTMWYSSLCYCSVSNYPVCVIIVALLSVWQSKFMVVGWPWCKSCFPRSCL